MNLTANAPAEPDSTQSAAADVAAWRGQVPQRLAVFDFAAAQRRVNAYVIEASRAARDGHRCPRTKEGS